MISRKDRVEIYATNKRLILKKGGMFGTGIIEASYRHISSIEYGRGQISSSWIVAGILITAFGVCIAVFGPFLGLLITTFVFGNPSGWYTWYGSVTSQFQIFWILPMICGAILIVIGVALSAQAPVYKIHVVGRKPIRLRGKRLEGLIKVIRQYQEEMVTADRVFS